MPDFDRDPVAAARGYKTVSIGKERRLFWEVSDVCGVNHGRFL
jgi:hypothetical protein